MRKSYALWLVVFGIALIVCTVKSIISKKPIAKKVLPMLISLLFPTIGNIIITLSVTEIPAFVGYYFYLLGTNWMLYFTAQFFITFCKLDSHQKAEKIISMVLIGIDSISVCLNVFIRRVFDITPVTLSDGTIYYSIVSFPFHKVHLIISYLFVAYIFALLIYRLITTPKIYVERYVILLITMTLTCMWETVYILGNIPIDISMVGYEVCGCLLYYFSVEYYPFFFYHEMLLKTVSDVDDCIFFFDNEGQCAFTNKAADKLKNKFGESERDSKEFVADHFFENNFNKGLSLCGKNSIVHNNSTYYFRYEYKALFDKKDRFIGSYFKLSDCTQEELETQRKLYLSTHDELTGIYNKNRFLEKVEQRLHENPDVKYYLMTSNIKDFKLINEIYGKKEADLLLTQIADSLKKYSTPEAIYCRLDNDRFALLAKQKDFNEEFFTSNSKVIFKLTHDMHYPVIVHLGVYYVTDIDMSVDSMLDRAFMALSTIKNDYNKIIAYYDDNLREERLWEQKIVGQLADAIADKQIQPYLQPQMDKDGNLKGAEVLVRWIHPTEGFLSPAKFVPILERNGLITAIDSYMWECACEILKKWKKLGIETHLSVNISPKDFYFVDLYKYFTNLVEKYEIDPHKLRLEITESVVMTDMENRLKTIRQLREEGFIIEMDDFGSGYSSLNMLKDIPLDIIKIDMMFLYKTKEVDKAKIILNTIIDLSKRLNLPTITEGVETKEQLDMLSEMGGVLYQGYYFSKPIPLVEFEKKYFNIKSDLSAEK